MWSFFSRPNEIWLIFHDQSYNKNMKLINECKNSIIRIKNKYVMKNVSKYYYTIS